MSNLRFEDAYYDGCRYIYFFSYEINGIFRMDLREKTVDFLLSVNEYYADEKRLYGSVVFIDNKLVFAPLVAYHILVYDIEKNTYKLYEVEHSPEIDNNVTKFHTQLSVDGCVYMFPAHYPAIIRFDLHGERIDYYTSWTESVPGMVKNKQDFFRHSACKRDAVIIAPFCSEDKVLLFDIINETTVIKEIGTGRKVDQGFSGICDDGNHLWLSSMRGDCVFRWEFAAPVVDSILVGNRNGIDMSSYVGCAHLNRKIIVFPAWENDLICIDPQSGEVEVLDFPPMEKENERKRAKVGSVIMSLTKIDDKLFLMCPRYAKEYYFIRDYRSTIVEGCAINYSNSIEKWARSTGCIKPEIRFEEDTNDLELFLKTV